MSKRTKIDPCLCCGGSHFQIIDVWPNTSVECANVHCRARGPVRASETEAVRAWNEMCRPRGLQVRGVAR